MISRKLIVVPVIVSILVISLSSFVAKKGGCDTEILVSKAVDQLKKFTMLQYFPVYFKKAKGNKPIEVQKHVITLSRGIRYKFFTVRNETYDGVPILAIYNNERLQSLLGTTYNALIDKNYNEIEFECRTTGNYCLAMSFKDGKEGCAVGIFSSLIQ